MNKEKCWEGKRSVLEICGFHKVFSEIPPFQKAYSLFYGAEQREPEGDICFRIARKGEKTTEEELWVSGIEIETALKAVRYLWENAVSAETWKEILADILAQIAET